MRNSHPQRVAQHDRALQRARVHLAGGGVCQGWLQGGASGGAHNLCGAFHNAILPAWESLPQGRLCMQYPLCVCVSVQMSTPAGKRPTHQGLASPGGSMFAGSM